MAKLRMFVRIRVLLVYSSHTSKKVQLFWTERLGALLRSFRVEVCYGALVAQSEIHRRHICSGSED